MMRLVVGLRLDDRDGLTFMLCEATLLCII